MALLIDRWGNLMNCLKAFMLAHAHWCEALPRTKAGGDKTGHVLHALCPTQ